MGEEIEIYILKKLDDAIEESRNSTEFHFAAKLFLPRLHKEFSDIRDLILKKRAKIRLAAAERKESNAPAGRDPPAAHVKKIPDADKDSKVLLPAAAVKKSQASRDDKETGAPSGAGGDKESASDAGEKKEMGTSKNAGDNDKETGEADADAPSDDDDVDDDGDQKELSAPSDDVDGGKKESGTPSDEIDDKKAGADESKASTPAMTRVASGGDKKDKIVGASSKTTIEDEPEISPATDAVTADKSITPPASATKTAPSAKTTSTVKPEITPVTDSGATDHKSKTSTASGGKKESGVPPADKSSASDASTKTDLKSVAKPVDEEDLLREQLYYINNVLTEWQMITKRPFSLSSDSVSSIKELSKTLKKIKQDLKPETTKKADESSHLGTPLASSSDNASLIRTTPEVVEYRWSTRVNLKKVYGFEDKILSLERLLVLRRKDTDTFKAFGIHGMAGVGKTTLCQSIFSRPKVREYFFPRIWVCLSKQKDEDEDNRKEVVMRMLRCLGIDDKIINKVDEKQSIRGLLFALRLQLIGKRYFIVLDDAHNPDEWFKMPDSDAENDNNKIYEKFSYGLPKECGGTVIVTSRVEQVVKNMVGEEENLRCIEPLTDQETCWNIFTDTVKEGDTQFPPDLEKLKAEIVKRCDGLPLAAKLLGQIKHKELRENPLAAINHRASGEAGNQ